MVTGAIQTGYKQAEGVVIPEDWELMPLGNYLDLLTDFEANGSFETVAKNVKIFDNPNFAWYVRATDLEKNTDISKVKYVNEDSFRFLKKTSLLGGEVLITKRGEIGKVYFFKKKTEHATLAPNLYLLKLNKKVIPYYIYFFLKSDFGFKLLNEKNASTTLGALYKEDVKAILLPIPKNLKEQEAIAQALSDTDNLIESLNKLILKKKDMKQGTMQLLLTGKKRLPGFNEEWEKNIIKRMVDIPVSDGPHLTPKFVERGIPFLSVNNLVNNKIDWSDPRYISKEDDLIFSKKCKPKKGDLLLGKAASVGLIAVVESDFDFNIWSPIALIRINKNYDTRYIYYCFQSKNTINQIKLLTNSSSQGNIGMGDIEKIEFSYPSKKEQTAIANILSSMDEDIEVLEKERDKYKMIKEGMMQQLLTGKVRLKW